MKVDSRKIWWGVVIFIVISFTGCGVSKKSVRRQLIQKDSSYSKVVDSLMSVKKLDSVHYETLLKQTRESGVIFDQTKCPPLVNIDSACNRDSAIKVIRILQGQLEAAQNTVEFYENGVLKKATGKIASANVKVESLQKEISDYKRQIDSLVNIKSKVEVKTETKIETKDRYVTRWSLSFLFILIAFILGCIFWNWKGNGIKGIAKKFFGKVTLK
jgi:transcription elongation factor Elf1